jgi:hypothetical protein
LPVKAVSGVGSSIAGKRLLLAVFGCASVAAHAELFDTPNDVGSVGLLQTPTARFADDGEFRVGISHVLPYNQAHFTAQALPWFETTFRYTDVTNVPYGPESFSGKQTYKDRSFGFKMRLLQEGEYWPAVALGVQDFGGTGVFDQPSAQSARPDFGALQSSSTRHCRQYHHHTRRRWPGAIVHRNRWPIWRRAMAYADSRRIGRDRIRRERLPA